MSLHHYDLGKLSELYGCDIPSNAFDLVNVDRQKLNVSCNLVKGYIDNPGEAKKMLDFTLDMDIVRIGFVALMKVNDSAGIILLTWKRLSLTQYLMCILPGQ